jgi:hypothetical protein
MPASVSILTLRDAQKTRESQQIYRQAKIGLREWHFSFYYQLDNIEKIPSEALSPLTVSLI